MLNKYEEIRYMLYVHSKELPLISCIRTKTYEVHDSHVANEALKYKQMGRGSQIPRREQLISAIIFEDIPYFQVFRI